MEIVLVALVVVAVLAAAILVGRRLGRTPPPPPTRPWETSEPEGAVVVLDLVPDDPSHPSVRRLVEEAAQRPLDTDPTVEVVEVRDREHRVLGRVRRPRKRRDVTIPDELYEPHAQRSRAPDPLGRSSTPPPPPPASAEAVEVADRPFAERFELDERIRAALADDDDPVDLVRVLLTLGGHRPEIHGDRVATEEVALVVMSDPGHQVDAALARAFLRIQEARVPRGIVIHLSWVNPETLHRREVAAPNVKHVGPEAIQRMADAVTAGADPVAFVLGPAVVG
jgi:hypothetical protein